MDYTGQDALLVIDVINDFAHPKGSLYAKDGELIIPGINQLSAQFKHVVVVSEWHPAGHEAFASTHKAEPFSVRQLSYGESVLWPDHGVGGTWGAEFPSELKPTLDRANLNIRKGMNPRIHSYSSFYEDDRITPTGLTGYLRQLGIRRVFSTGIAFDYCVGFGAVDAVRDGFESFVFRSLTASIGLPTTEGRTTVDDMEDQFASAGVRVI